LQQHQQKILRPEQLRCWILPAAQHPHWNPEQLHWSQLQQKRWNLAELHRYSAEQQS
jgi:hypothetical protein